MLSLRGEPQVYVPVFRLNSEEIWVTIPTNNLSSKFKRDRPNSVCKP